MTSPLALVKNNHMPFGLGPSISLKLLTGIRYPKSVLAFSTSDPTTLIAILLLSTGPDPVPFGRRVYKGPATLLGLALASGPNRRVGLPILLNSRCA